MSQADRPISENVIAVYVRVHHLWGPESIKLQVFPCTREANAGAITNSDDPRQTGGHKEKIDSPSTNPLSVSYAWVLKSKLAHAPCSPTRSADL